MSETLSSKQDAILSAATDSFAANGFAAARIEDIAKSAGVGKGTIYEYYRSKELLLLSCCTALCAQLTEKISAPFANQESVQAQPAMTLYQLMYQAIFTVVDSGEKNLRLFILLWTVADKEPHAAKEIQKSLQTMYDAWELQCKELYLLGIEHGALRPIRYIDVPGRCLSALVDGWLWQRSFRPDMDAHTLAHEFAYNFLEQHATDPQFLEQLT